MNKNRMNNYNKNIKEFFKRGGSLFLSLLMIFQIFASQINANTDYGETNFSTENLESLTRTSDNNTIENLTVTDRDFIFPLPVIEGLDVQFQPTKLEKEGEYPQKITWEVRVRTKKDAYSDIWHSFTTSPDSGLGKPEIVKIERVTENGKEELQRPTPSEAGFDYKSISIKQNEMRKDADYLITIDTPIIRLRDNYLLDYHLIAKERGSIDIKEGHIRIAAPIYNVLNRGELIATKVLYLDKNLQPVEVYDPSALSDEEREKIAIVRNISGIYESDSQIKWTVSDTNVRNDKGQQISKVKPMTDSSNRINRQSMVELSPNKNTTTGTAYGIDYFNTQSKYDNASQTYSSNLPYGDILVYEFYTSIENNKSDEDHYFWDDLNPNKKAGLKALKKRITINKRWRNTAPIETSFNIRGYTEKYGVEKVERVIFNTNETTKQSTNLYYILDANNIAYPRTNRNRFIYPINEKKLTVEENIPSGYKIVESSSDKNSGTYNFTNGKIETDDGHNGNCTNDGIIKVNPVEFNQIFRIDNDGYWYNWAADLSGTIRAKQGLKEGDYYTLELPKDISLNKAVSATQLFFKANDSRTGKTLFNIYYPELGKLRFVATKDLEKAVTSGSLDIDWRVGSTARMPARGGKINGRNVAAGTSYPWGFVIDKNYIYDYDNWPLWNKKSGLNGKLTKTMEFTSTSSTEKNCIKPIIVDSITHLEDNFDDGANRFLEKRVVEEELIDGKTRLLFEITSTLGNYKGNDNSEVLPDFWLIDHLSAGGGQLPLWNADSLQKGIDNGSVRAYYATKVNQIGGYDPSSLVNIPVSTTKLGRNDKYVLASGYNSEAGDILFTAKNIPRGTMLVLKINTWFKKSINNSSYAQNDIEHEVMNAASFQNQRLYYRYNPTTGSGSSLAPLTFSFDIVKTDENGRPITTSRAEFLLKKKDGTPIYKKSTDENGIITFDGLRAGEYILSEVKAPKGYVIGDKKRYEVVVEKNGKVTIDGNPLNGTFSISNPEDNSSFEIQKQNEKGLPLSGAEFTLTDEDGNTKIGEEYPVGSGKFTFDKLKKGKRYKLKETKAPEGYQRIKTDWDVYVLNNGNVNITGENGTIDGNKIIIKNKKQLKFTVKKVDDSKPAKPLKGVEFTLYKVPSYLSEPIKAITNESGIAEFTNLSSGKYILAETKGIEGYEKLDKTWKVELSENGLITTSDRSADVSIVEREAESITTSFRSVGDIVNNRYSNYFRSSVNFTSSSTERAISDENFTINKTTRRVETGLYEVNLEITRNNFNIDRITVFDNYDSEKFELVRDDNNNGIYDNFNQKHYYSSFYRFNIDYSKKPNVNRSSINYKLRLKPEYHNGEEYRTSVYLEGRAPRIEWINSNGLNSMSFPQSTIIAPYNLSQNIKITGKVSWNMLNSIYKPKSVKLKLYKIINDTKEQVLIEEQVVSENNNWEYVWNNLPKTENGRYIKYIVEQEIAAPYSDYWYDTVNIIDENLSSKKYSFTNFINENINSNVNVKFNIKPSGYVLKNIKLKLIPKVEGQEVEIPNLNTIKNITLDSSTKNIEWSDLPSLYNEKPVSYDVEIENINEFTSWSINKRKNGKLFEFDFVKSSVDMVVVNPKKTSKLIINKVNEEGTPLPGAEFLLTEIEKNIELRNTSDKNGEIVYENLKPGKYRLTEDKAPEGYNLLSDVWNVTVDKKGNIEVDGAGGITYSNNKVISNNEIKKDIIADGNILGSLKAVLSEKGSDYNLKLIVDLSNVPRNITPKLQFKENLGFTVKGRFNEIGGYKTIFVFKISNENIKEYNITLSPNDNFKYDKINSVLNELKMQFGYYGVKDFSEIIPTLNVSEKPVKSIRVVNEKLSVNLFKKSDENGAYLEGAKFELIKINADGTREVIKNDIRSDKGGNIKVTGIEKGGTYELWETKAPEGYSKPTGFVKKFTIDSEGLANFDENTPGAYVFNSKIKYNLHIKKRDADEVDEVMSNVDNSDSYDKGKKLVATLELQKKNDDGSYVKVGDDIVTSSDNGYALINNIVDGSYKIIEKTQPENYKILESPVEFTIYNGIISNISGDGRVFLNNGTGLDIVAIVKNKKIKTDIDIKKTDLNGNGIMGSTFAIYEAEENIVNNTETDENKVNKPFKIKQKKDSLINVDPLTIFSPQENGTLVNNKGPGYSAGIYILKELVTPPGYQSPPNEGEIPFYIKEDGSIIIPAKKINNGYVKDEKSPYADLVTVTNDDEYYPYRYTVLGNNKVLDKITIKNVSKYNLHIKKRDAEDVDKVTTNINNSDSYDAGKKLVAKLKLFRNVDLNYVAKENEEILKINNLRYLKVKEVTTDLKNGYALIEDLVDGDYLLEEIDPPIGYIKLKNRLSFTFEKGALSNVNGEGKIFLNNKVGKDFVAVVKNRKIKTDIKIYKKNMAGEKLSGAVFQIYKADADGNATGNALQEKRIDNEEVTATGEGYDVFNNSDQGGFEQGAYVLREKSSPSGYQKLQDITFYVEESGNIIIPAKKDDKGKWIEDKKTNLKNFVDVKNDNKDYQWRYDSTRNPDSNKVLDTITVKNKKAVYPATGGIGTELFIVVGITIMCGAVLIIRKRNKIK